MNRIGLVESGKDIGTAKHGLHLPCGRLQDQPPAHPGITGDGLLHWLGSGITPTCLPWAPDQRADEYSK
jgi:hypothetical protein